MNADLLYSFITKYYLDGSVEEAKWIFNDGKLKVDFLSSIGDCVGEIQINDESFDQKCEIGILNTSALISMVKILDGLMELNIEKSPNNIPIKLILNDSNFDTYYHLADLQLFRKVPRVDEPSYDLSMNIDMEFANKFIRGKSALDKEINHFTIESGTQNNIPGLKVEIGGKEALSHKIKFFHEDPSCKGEVKKQTFNGTVFKSIFGNNKNFDSGTLSISNEGLMKVVLQSDAITCTYFLVKSIE
jgi:hypothetical protein